MFRVTQLEKYRIVIWYRVWYCAAMEVTRKITIELPEVLVKKALKASGEGLTPTIRKGLELITAAKVFEDLRRWRGKYKSSVSLARLREDRR